MSNHTHNDQPVFGGGDDVTPPEQKPMSRAEALQEMLDMPNKQHDSVVEPEAEPDEIVNENDGDIPTINLDDITGKKKEDVEETTENETVEEEESPKVEQEELTFAPFEMNNKNPYKVIDGEKWTKLNRESEEGMIPIAGVCHQVWQQLNKTRQEKGQIDKDQPLSTAEYTQQRSATFWPRDNVYSGVCMDPDREFVQSIQREKAQLRINEPLPEKMQGNGTKLTGKLAVWAVRAQTGLSTMINVPLWHSGFWITLGTPKADQLVNLDTNVWSSRIIMGRNLNGAVFANDQVYLAEHFLEFVKENIIKTTLVDDEDIISKIKIGDIQTLALAMAYLVWSRGYKFARSVFSKDPSVDRIVHGLIDLSKLLWVDHKALSEKQIRHMTQRFTKGHSDESLEAYQKEFVRPMEKTYELNDGLRVTLHQPSIADWLEAGENWVQNTISATEGLLTEDDNDEKRNNILVAFAKANLSEQYLHFVKSFTFIKEDDNGIEEVEKYWDDEETIVEFCKFISTERSNLDKFIKACLDFIDASAVSIVATPSVCEDEDNIHPYFPHLVPMDALYTFFTLLIQKLEAIKKR